MKTTLLATNRKIKAYLNCATVHLLQEKLITCNVSAYAEKCLKYSKNPQEQRFIVTSKNVSVALM